MVFNSFQSQNRQLHKLMLKWMIAHQDNLTFAWHLKQIRHETEHGKRTGLAVELWFFYLRPNKQLSTESICRWFETQSRTLWRLCDETECQNSIPKSLVQILHSAEDDNLSPFEFRIACLCQSIEINNNKYAYRQSQARKPNGSGVEWAECSLIIG